MCEVEDLSGQCHFNEPEGICSTSILERAHDVPSLLDKLEKHQNRLVFLARVVFCPWWWLMVLVCVVVVVVTLFCS